MTTPDLAPASWTRCSVGDLAAQGEQVVLTGPFGSGLGRDDFLDSGVPVLTIGCLSLSGLGLDKALHVSPEKAASLARYRVREGDVLFSRMASVGRAAVVKKAHEGALINYHLMRLRIDVALCAPSFLTYYVQGSPVVAEYVRSVAHGATRAGINTAELLALPVTLPPRPEQDRIVAEIEKHFTRLDAAVAALKRVQANLKRYRAAVLKAACEGRLVPTEAELARREGRSYETGEELLHRAMRSRGPRDGVRSEVLPEGWALTRLREVAELRGGITKGQRRAPGTQVRLVPYLRVANVQRGFLDLNEVKTIEATEDEMADLRLQPGDVLFNEGGDRDKLGRGWVWKGQIAECIHQNHVFRARLVPEVLIPRWLSWYGNSVGQQYFWDEGKHTTNLASINLTKLGLLPVLVPPQREQGRIVLEVDRQLSILDELGLETARALRRGECLRQAVLRTAFEGRLVQQDAADEPARVLLDRMRAERGPVPVPRPQKVRGARSRRRTGGRTPLLQD